MKKKNKQIPVFQNEDQEREFWAKNSPLDYMKSSSVSLGNFPKLKPTLKSISIRLPENMLNELKILANKRDIPYQSLAKLYLSRQILMDRKQQYI